MANVTGTLVEELIKSGEAPGPDGGDGWFFFSPISPRGTGDSLVPSITLTEQDWLNLGKPERISLTIENADEESAA